MPREETPLQFADVETSSAEYAGRFAGPAGEWLLRVQTDILRDLLAFLPSSGRELSFLDVGGGHGQITAPLVQSGYKVSVLGSSPQCVQQIKELVASKRCAFFSDNLLNTSFKDCSYDVVTCIRLLAHCEEWPKLISELCRLAGAAVIVDYPPLLSFNAFYPLFFPLKKGVEENTRSFALFRHRQIEQEFFKNGFKLKRKCGQFFWPMVLHRLLGNPLLSARLEKFFDYCGLARVFGSPTLALFVREKR